MASLPYKVALTVNGIFHLFDLAGELAKREMLAGIYSSFHWGRLKREGLERSYVHTFPWIHPAQLAIQRHAAIPAIFNRPLDRLVRSGLDHHVAKVLMACDVYVALSGSGFKSGSTAQRRGAAYVCDRGSSHIRFQDRIVREEYRIWGYEQEVVDPYFVEREEAEYSQADAITVPSSFALRSFVQMGVPKEKLRRIPYGVRLDRFRRVAEPPRDEFRVLFAGTVSLRKGVPYLLEAFRALRHPRKRLRLVGPVTGEMQGLLHRFDLTDVELVGRVPQVEMTEYMSSSHVMVLPSIEEGLALVQGQAMACGCPLISSEHTGGEDLFSESVEGFLVPIRSSAVIAQRLQQLADDVDLQQRMSEAALARVQSLGGWSEYGDQWANLVTDLVEKRFPTVAQ